jgi:long-subunit acyl-CoA synthetase (AMP-forming)
MDQGRDKCLAATAMLFNDAALAWRQPDGIDRSQALRRLLRFEGMQPFHRVWIISFHRPELAAAKSTCIG